MIISDEQGRAYDKSNPLPESLQGVVSVTPSDSVNLPDVTYGIYVGGAGNVSVVMNDSSTATFTGLSVGVIHRLAVKRVNATGTTATNILALY